MAIRPPIDMAGCVLLKKYYCQLHFLQSRFPMGKDGVAAVTFIWYVQLHSIHILIVPSRLCLTFNLIMHELITLILPMIRYMFL